MSDIKIVTLPSTILRKKSKSVRIQPPATDVLINQMITATIEWEKGRQHEVGVALAAIQIGKPLRAIIVRQEPSTSGDKPSFEVLLNPQVIKLDGEILESHEGCLSVPDVYGLVPRYTKIRLTAETPQGELVRIKARGFLARVLQHELDHLEGKLFIDHVKNNNYYRLTKDGNYEHLTDDEIRQYSFLR